MTADFEHLAASVLNSSASAYAGLAARKLVHGHPDAARHFGPDALSMWRSHLTVRAQELAVAVEFDAPQVMRSAIEWTRGSFQARDVPEEDLRASLECLRDVLAEELPEQAREKPIEFVDGAIRTMDEPSTSSTVLKAIGANEELALAYIEACLSGNSRQAMRLILGKVESGCDMQTIYFDVLAPAQREVGRLWHAAKIGVHEEHFVTSTTLSLLSLLSHQATLETENGKTVVGAAIGGDGHDLGVRMIMDFFSMAGWTSICLGSSVPGVDLARAMQDFDADLLVLSVTLVTNLRFLRAAVHDVREAVPAAKILVGGQAFADAPDVWRAVGADELAMRADEAVASGARLVGIKAP
jgi:methanogenic corrinoid protein MtbC1